MFVRNGIAFVALAVSAACAALGQTPSPRSYATAAERQLDRVRDSPPALYAFLLRMPKGADLHNHLSGAVYAESFIRDAAAQSLCIDDHALSFVRPANRAGQCADGQTPAARALEDNQLFGSLIDSLSMRNFVPGRESAHDHFFATFDKFSAASREESGVYAAEVTRRAAEQNESYLELMAVSGGAVTTLGKKVGLAGFDETASQLRAAGLPAYVERLKADVDAMEQERRAALNCPASDSPSCRVAVRYIFQVLRALPKEQVFAQVLAGFMLASSDPLVVAINLVQPEDYLDAMRDYHLHMQMVDYVRRLYPNVHITLHAGELASGLVPPDGLRFHIREAVEIGHAERIGHGVDIMYENDAVGLLELMHRRRIAVEINLTSNDLILGVKGNAHPFPIYRRHGVPVVISTDDEGVSRSHLTEEYLRAVLAYHLTYADLKQIVRDSLEFAFLPGASYWGDPAYRSPVAACAAGARGKSCQDFLSGSEKARLQLDLEQRFEQFERAAAPAPPRKIE
ncbi:MAG: adenosine deaminase [Acidobacteriaceae bacterium]|nr:adenosine deaminase [Acidobacteriaceae bacterium]